MSSSPFPVSPIIGQEVTLGGITWKWDGDFWLIVSKPNGGAGGTLDGDVTGPVATTVVEAIRGSPISSTAPSTVSEVLAWSGSSWGPVIPAVGGGPLAGDVTGPLNATVLSKIQGFDVRANNLPSRGQALIWMGQGWENNWSPSGPYLKASDYWGDKAYNLQIQNALNIQHDLVFDYGDVRIGTANFSHGDRPKAPENDQVITWCGSSGLGWQPSGPYWPRSWAAGGDLGGTLGSTKVRGIAGTPVAGNYSQYPPATLSPQPGQALVWNVHYDSNPSSQFWSPSGPYLKSANRWGDQTHYLSVLNTLSVAQDLSLDLNARIGTTHSGNRPNAPRDWQALVWYHGFGWNPSGPFWERSWAASGDVNGTLGSTVVRGFVNTAVGGPKSEYPPRALNPLRKQALIWNNDGSTNPNSQFWTPSGPYLMSANVYGSSTYWLEIEGSPTNTDQYNPSFRCNGLARFEGHLYGVGGVWTPGGTVNSTSDTRTKEKVEPYKTGIDEIKKLEPISYQYNGKGGTLRDGKTYYGLAAEDAQKAIPEMVTASRGKLNKDDKDETDILSTDNGPLLYAIVNALKAIDRRLTALESPTSPTTGRVGGPSPVRRK